MDSFKKQTRIFGTKVILQMENKYARDRTTAAEQTGVGVPYTTIMFESRVYTTDAEGHFLHKNCIFKVEFLSNHEIAFFFERHLSPEEINSYRLSQGAVPLNFKPPGLVDTLEEHSPPNSPVSQSPPKDADTQWSQLERARQEANEKIQKAMEDRAHWYTSQDDMEMEDKINL